MPASSEHKRKAEHNELFAKSIDGGTNADWIVIALFYSALHYIDAFLALKGIHPVHHTGPGSRDNEIKASLSVIWNEYRYLKDESETARYETRTIRLEDVTADVLPDFETIKRFIKPSTT